MLYISSKNWNKVRNIGLLAKNFNIFKKSQNTHILYDGIQQQKKKEIKEIVAY